MTYLEIAAEYDRMADQLETDCRERSDGKGPSSFDEERIIGWRREALHYRFLATARPEEAAHCDAQRRWAESAVAVHAMQVEHIAKQTAAWERMAAALEKIVEEASKA